MDEKRYSLNDIFALLNEATSVLQNSVQIVSEDEEGNRVRTDMKLNEAVAMMVGHELTWDMSRLSSDTTMATKEEVIEAMKLNNYDEIAFPVYEHFGIRMKGGRRTRKTRSH